MSDAAAGNRNNIPRVMTVTTATRIRDYLQADYYATTEDAFPTDCFAGASATSTTPTIANTTTPASSRRSITFRYSCAAIYPSMRKICPSAEGDQAAVRRWVTHR